MRIVLDARYLDGSYSGIATYSRRLIEHLSSIDQENSYHVVVRPSFRERLDIGENFELLTYRPKPISWQSYFDIHKWLDQIQPDVFHSLAPHMPVFYPGKTILTVHDMQPFVDPEFSSKRIGPIQSAYSLFYRWAYPNSIAKAKWVLCDSYATRDDVARILPGAVDKLVVVRPGLDQTEPEEVTDGQRDSIRNKLGIRGRFFLYYGSTRPNKNLTTLVRAFGELVHFEETPQDVQLVLVVKKDRFFKETQKIINQLNLSDRVVVCSPLKPAEQRALLSAALSFVFPTKYEGFGFPPLEAMRAGIPVLGTESGSLPEVLGDAALICSPDDPSDIAAKLGMLESDGELRETLIERGHQQIKQFDWKYMAEFVADFYRILL